MTIQFLWRNITNILIDCLYYSSVFTKYIVNAFNGSLAMNLRHISNATVHTRQCNCCNRRLFTFFGYLPRDIVFFSEAFYSILHCINSIQIHPLWLVQHKYELFYFSLFRILFWWVKWLSKDERKTVCIFQIIFTFLAIILY